MVWVEECGLAFSLQKTLTAKYIYTMFYNFGHFLGSDSRIDF